MTKEIIANSLNRNFESIKKVAASQHPMLGNRICRRAGNAKSANVYERLDRQVA